MLLTANDFQEQGRALTAAKKDPANYCQKANAAPPGCEDNGDGTYSMWQKVSGRATGRTVTNVPRPTVKWDYRDTDEGGTEKYVTIDLGVHGLSHVGIDPKTGKAGCVACKGAK